MITELCSYISEMLLHYRNKERDYKKNGYKTDTINEIVLILQQIQAKRMQEKQQESRIRINMCIKCEKISVPNKFYDPEAFRAHNELEVKNKWPELF